MVSTFGVRKKEEGYMRNSKDKKKYCVTVFDATDMQICDFYLDEEEIKLPFTYPKKEEPFEEFSNKIKSFIPAETFKQRRGLGKRHIYVIYCSPEQDEFLKMHYNAYFKEDGRGMPIAGGNVIFGEHYSDSQVGDVNTCLQLNVANRPFAKNISSTEVEEVERDR